MASSEQWMAFGGALMNFGLRYNEVQNQRLRDENLARIQQKTLDLQREQNQSTADYQTKSLNLQREQNLLTAEQNRGLLQIGAVEGNARLDENGNWVRDTEAEAARRAHEIKLKEIETYGGLMKGLGGSGGSGGLYGYKPTDQQLEDDTIAAQVKTIAERIELPVSDVEARSIAVSLRKHHQATAQTLKMKEDRYNRLNEEATSVTLNDEERAAARRQADALLAEISEDLVQANYLNNFAPGGGVESYLRRYFSKPASTGENASSSRTRGAPAVTPLGEELKVFDKFSVFLLDNYYR